jgi:hypothetical protein
MRIVNAAFEVEAKGKVIEPGGKAEVRARALRDR